MSNTYYHNPRCSKSRQGLELLKSKEFNFEVKEYLKVKMTQTELEDIIQKIGGTLDQGLVRVKEAKFKELGLKGKELTNKEWAKIICENPILLERPLLLTAKKAKIGRPPEQLLEII